MSDKWSDRTTALAGLFQAVTLVDRLATTGYLPKEEYQTCVQSLLTFNPESAIAPFGSEKNLEAGFKAIVNNLSGDHAGRSAQVIRYALGVFYLQSKLVKRDDILEIIRTRLDQAANQAQHFDVTHDNVIRNLADTYVDTLGKFMYRIHVRGDATYLQQERVAAQIRTLLFAAVRCAILWRQLGGRRWQLFFYRKQLVSSARKTLSTIKTTIH